MKKSELKKLIKEIINEEYVSIEYPMNPFWKNQSSIDAEIKNFAAKFGGWSDGSGSDGKWRDIGFPMDDKASADKLRAALKKQFKKYKVRVF